MGRSKISISLPMLYVGLPHCAMIGHPGRVLFRLLSECVSAWMISSVESLCTLGSRYIFPQLFCLAVCDRNLWVVLSIWFASSRSLIVLISWFASSVGSGVSLTSV